MLVIPRQQVIFGIREYKNKINKFTVTSIAISFRSSSNNTPSSPPYCVGIKRKSVPEEKSDEELPAVVGDYFTYSQLVNDDDLKMGDMKLL